MPAVAVAVAAAAAGVVVVVVVVMVVLVADSDRVFAGGAICTSNSPLSESDRGECKYKKLSSVCSRAANYRLSGVVLECGSGPPAIVAVVVCHYLRRQGAARGQHGGKPGASMVASHGQAGASRCIFRAS